MKTRLMLMPLILVAAGLTVGCDNSGSTPSAAPAPAPKKAVKDDHAGHDHKDGDHHDGDGHDHSKDATTAPAPLPAR
jgi:hypothetical protein